MREAHERARSSLKGASRRQKKQYDRRAHGSPIQAGSFVWLYSYQRKPGISKKLRLPWEGPFLVLQKLSDVHCKIQRSPRAKCRIIHVDRLKPYEGPTMKPWSTTEYPADQEETKKPKEAGPRKPEKQPDEFDKCTKSQNRHLGKSVQELNEKSVHELKTKKLPNNDNNHTDRGDTLTSVAKCDKNNERDKIPSSTDQKDNSKSYRRNPRRNRRLPERYR